MATITQEQKIKTETKPEKIAQLQIKAALFDELLEFIEDRYFGYLMSLTEKEKSIPLSKAKRLLR